MISGGMAGGYWPAIPVLGVAADKIITLLLLEDASRLAADKTAVTLFGTKWLKFVLDIGPFAQVIAAFAANCYLLLNSNLSKKQKTIYMTELLIATTFILAPMIFMFFYPGIDPMIKITLLWFASFAYTFVFSTIWQYSIMQAEEINYVR